MVSDTAPAEFHEVQSTKDALWPAWWDLYLGAFPANERMTEAYFQGVMARKERGEAPNEHPLAMRTPAGEFVGMAYYDMDADLGAAFLWYLATREARRGQGLGAQFYSEILRRAKKDGARLLVFEVEIPELADQHSPEAGGWARRRIDWYRRNGARVLTGIHYLQSVDSDVPPTPMHLMVHPMEPMHAQAVFDVSRQIFGDALTQIGELGLA